MWRLNNVSGLMGFIRIYQYIYVWFIAEVKNVGQLVPDQGSNSNKQDTYEESDTTWENRKDNYSKNAGLYLIERVKLYPIMVNFS